MNIISSGTALQAAGGITQGEFYFDGSDYYQMTEKGLIRLTHTSGATFTSPTLTGATITSPTISAPTITGGLTSDVLQAATHGAGAIGTSSFGAPKTYIRTENGDIITTIKIDLTGLSSISDDNDVIGIKAGAPVSYLMQYVAATHGVIYKGEMTCLEVPTAAANPCTDIDLLSSTGATGAFDTDGAGYTAVVTAGGAWTLGLKKDLTAIPTANHYLYLCDGATHTAESVFTGGQFLIKFYGHAVLA